MEIGIENNKYKLVLIILPETLLIGLAFGYGYDDFGKFHKMINFGLALVWLSLIIKNEKTHEDIYG